LSGRFKRRIRGWWIIWPEIYMGMGLTAEQVQRKYGISREDSGCNSRIAAIRTRCARRRGATSTMRSCRWKVASDDAGRRSAGDDGDVFTRDEGPRADTSLEALAKLKPVFTRRGTVTAGNSSQTSDGAAAALVMSEKKARELGLKPMARFVSFAVAGVPPEIMGIGPVVAIPKALAMAGLKLDDIGVIELNEAFAVQALAVIRRRGWMDRVNVNGGAIALGIRWAARGRS
jgi:acetyl-CoA acyltransferase